MHPGPPHRPRAYQWWALWLAGCADAALHEPPPGTPTTLSVVCALAEDNPLRAWCDVTVEPSTAVEIRFGPAGEQTRLAISEPDSMHRIGLYGMPAQSLIDWTAVAHGIEVKGAFRTGSLPDGARFRIDREGRVPDATLLHISPCEADATIVVTDTTHGVIWYQQVEGNLLNVVHTHADTVLANFREVREFDWMGQELLSLTATEGRRFHHDAVRHGDDVWVLVKALLHDKGHTYNMDGIEVFDRSGSSIATWWLWDHWLPEGPDPRHGFDVAHANALYVDDDIALVSMRHLSMVLAIEPDLEADDFGAVRWRLEGNPSQSRWGSDLEVIGPEPRDFVQQHHAALLPDGRLSLYDNRTREDSRALELELDFPSATARIVQVYPLPTHCNFQGGSTRLSNGDALVTCAPRGQVYGFPAGSERWTWRLDTTCETGRGGTVPRFIELAW